MKLPRGVLRSVTLLFGLVFVWACPFDTSLREYLTAYFWLPLSKFHSRFERPNVHRISAPFAGMAPVQGDSPLAKLRAAYQGRDQTNIASEDRVAAARTDRTLTPREREEVDMIDAKFDLFGGEMDDELLRSAKKKLESFLKTARTPEYLSEARGWLARVHYLRGDQTAAGKIYLDELNRDGSNLSRETLLNSLRMNYGYDGGPELLAHLDEYFDTPEHAAFAIQLATNPRWSDKPHREIEDAQNRFDRAATESPYSLIQKSLEKHSDLLKSDAGANTLALLSMRVALRMGDPPAAQRIAENIPADAPIRQDPDFIWMLASARFLSRDYAAAETPLRALFQSRRASLNQKAAAAYGLCGVYWKTGNVAEQLRYALWLFTTTRKHEIYADIPRLSDFTVYWATSGWDLNMLLDAEASTEALQEFVDQNPNLENIRLVKYSLAVRLARENRYDESAEIYQSINAVLRAPRMRQLATLYRAVTEFESLEAKYKLAEFLSANSDRIYFNDALWHGYQQYALQASIDSRLTGTERQSLMHTERKLQDDQEERWRAYQIFSGIATKSPKTELGRKAAIQAIHCLERISDRFNRQEERQKAARSLAKLLRP